MLRKNQSQELAAYVVWVPQLRGKVTDVAPATSLVADARASHFWDPDDKLGERFGRVLQIGEPAWDVYLLDARGKTWRGADPPAPDFWMHQLGGVTVAPRLDSATFSQHAAALLARR